MSARYVVHLPGITYSKENPTKMLDGGEYVLFNNYTTTLECWNVHRDTLIWTYDKHDPKSHVSQFAAGVVDGDGSANIIVCEWRWTPDGVPDQRLSVKECPGEKSYGFTDAKICGSIASAALHPRPQPYFTPDSYCILMNWKTFTIYPSTRHFGIPTLLDIIRGKT
ncbi:hypothetical protein B0H13DRAFT_1884227 [Mycena leptocephala]|nr:hypothetical protein B0H13DRAFT_1884227 [Mycena leptocephala]